jgi:hypothetical protein
MQNIQNQQNFCTFSQNQQQQPSTNQSRRLIEGYLPADTAASATYIDGTCPTSSPTNDKIHYATYTSSGQSKRKCCNVSSPTGTQFDSSSNCSYSAIQCASGYSRTTDTNRYGKCKANNSDAK